MFTSSLQTFIAFPVINNDLILRSLLQEADLHPDALLIISNLESRTILHLNHKFEGRLGYSSEEAVQRGPEYLFSIVDEDVRPELIARQASFVVFAKQANFDPRNVLIQEKPMIVKMKNGTKVKMHSMCTCLTFTAQQDPEFCIELWSEANNTSVSQCMELLFKLKMRHNEVYRHAPFQHESNPLVPVYVTNTKQDHLLSKREQEVVKLLSKGLSTKEIAQQLQISFNTIETHRKHLLQKFEAKNVAELIKKASKVFWLE